MNDYDRGYRDGQRAALQKVLSSITLKLASLTAQEPVETELSKRRPVARPAPEPAEEKTARIGLAGIVAQELEARHVPALEQSEPFQKIIDLELARDHGPDSFGGSDYVPDLRLGEPSGGFGGAGSSGDY